MNIVLLHYAAPPIIGGVESVLGRHALLMAQHGHSVRIIAGQGVVTTRNPSSFGATGFPASSRISIFTPGNGRVPEPGFNATHGIGVIMNMPVSVCHHVSIIGQLPLPITR